MLREAETTRSLINRIRKQEATLFGHVMKREKLEHLVPTEIMEENASGENSEKRC